MADIVFTGLFFIEALLKIVAQGLVLNGPESYLRDPWNVSDFILLLGSASGKSCRLEVKHFLVVDGSVARLLFRELAVFQSVRGWVQSFNALSLCGSMPLISFD